MLIITNCTTPQKRNEVKSRGSTTIRWRKHESDQRQEDHSQDVSECQRDMFFKTL